MYSLYENHENEVHVQHSMNYKIDKLNYYPLLVLIYIYRSQFCSVIFRTETGIAQIARSL